MSLLLFSSALLPRFIERFGEIPRGPVPQTPTASASTQCPADGSRLLAPTPRVPFAVRFCANTVATGRRGLLQAFYPFTLCARHYRYFCVRAALPPGEAMAPYQPHPDDYRPGVGRERSFFCLMGSVCAL